MTRAIEAALRTVRSGYRRAVRHAMRAAMIRASFPAAILAALLALPVPTAVAQETDPELTRLYRLALSAEMCGFPVSEKQAEAIGKAMDRRIGDLKLTDEAADALYQKIEADMEAENWDALCAKGGTWAKAYAAELRKFGK